MSARSRNLYPSLAMCSFRPWRLSPSRRSNIRPVASASSGMTLMSRRVSGFMVVSHIMSGSFSPRPLDRSIFTFFPSSFFTISAFSFSE